MKMVTRCPACHTAFRIHRDQLDARGGQVRCGHCAVVFDAHADLQVEPELPPPMVELAEDNGLVINIETDAPAEDIPVEEVEEHRAAEETLNVQTLEETLETIKTAAQIAVEKSEEGAAEPLLLEEYGFGQPEQQRSRAATFLWGLTAFLLFGALMAQLAFHFRTDLTAYAPQLQPWLQKACDGIGCTIPLPQRTDLVSIEADEMQVAPERAELLVLSAVLRNRATFDQAYPAIELTLTDDSQIAVVRRVLQPAEYLDAKLRDSRAFAANSEVALKLYIDATGLSASGYRMEVLYL